MTAEKLHDALNLLPSDLLTATDQLRTAPKTKIIPWKRMLPLAACLAILICSGALCKKERTLPRQRKLWNGCRACLLWTMPRQRNRS